MILPGCPEGCRFKRCEEIIKVKEPSAKIDLAFFHLFALSACAKKMPVGKMKLYGLGVFSGNTSAVPCPSPHPFQLLFPFFISKVVLNLDFLQPRGNKLSKAEESYFLFLVS